MNRLHPSLSDVTALSSVANDLVSEDDIDVNGHMTVRRYFDVLTTGTITACGEYGLDLSYPAAEGMGLFSVDHHARYLRELRLGSRYSAHVRLLNASERGVHTMAYLVDLEGRQVSSTLESLLLNVDLTTRRVARFTDTTIEALSADLARSRELPSEVRGCGMLRLSGRSLAR